MNGDAPAFTPSKPQTQQETFYNYGSQISLRTVPVLISANGKTLKVNALYDDGSTKTYVIREIITVFGLDGCPENVKVNLLNGTKETLDTETVSMTLENLEGENRTEIDALVVENVTGNLRTIIWNEHSHNWKHLNGIQFSVVGKKSKVDILIG